MYDCCTGAICCLPYILVLHIRQLAGQLQPQPAAWGLMNPLHSCEALQACLLHAAQSPSSWFEMWVWQY